MSTVTLAQLAESIAETNYRVATDSFCRLVIDEGQSLRDVVRTAISATAPFIQLPSHLITRDDEQRQTVAVPYDHTILGWRAALALGDRMPGGYETLPAVQAIWYAPQGLDIWGQTICEFPGAYSKIFECAKRYPEPDPQRFDGPPWVAPAAYYSDRAPATKDSIAETASSFRRALFDGDRDRAYELFLGLARRAQCRDFLKGEILKAGIRDLQETLINHVGYQNIGHKALRARALVDTADFLGWDQAHDIFYTVVPDLGSAPRLFALWTQIGQIVNAELAGMGDIAKRAIPLDERSNDRLTETMLWGGPVDVNSELVNLFRQGHGLLDVSDSVYVAYLRHIIDLDHPSSFGFPTHALDYGNVVTTWLRGFTDIDQPRGPFMMARFMNDTIRYNATFPRDPKFELESRHVFRAWADEIPLPQILDKLIDLVVLQDCLRAGALVDSYLERTSERQDILRALAFAACHFQDDPHLLRNSWTMIEEFEHNETSRRDDFIRVFARFQSRFKKRTLDLDAYRLFESRFAKR